MSLWSAYVKERLGHEVVETGWGFVSYKITGGVCEMFDIYVVPEERRGRRAWTLVDEVAATARQQQCKALVGYVWPGLPGAESSLSAHLAYGFRLHSTESGKIVMMKDLGEV